MMAPGRPVGVQQPTRVAPLEAQPLPFPHRHYRPVASNVDDGDSKPAADGSGGDDDGALDEYECKICFEILHEPRGCGSCPNRFCKECLEQVWKTAVRHPNVAVADLAALRIDTSRKAGKCPCCRAPFSLDDLQGDDDLVENMKARKVICPFPGCHDEILLTDLKSHEATCGHQPVKCKYAPYGCDWTGLRKDLDAHEKCDCPYGRISKLVEEVRILKASHEQQVVRMQMNISRLSHQVASNRGNGTGNGGGGYGMISSEDPGSLFDCLKFAALCLSSPNKIISNKFAWNKFACASVQAKLVNTATVLPLVIWSLRVSFAVAVSTHFLLLPCA